VRVNVGWAQISFRKHHTASSPVPALAENARTGHPFHW
jgi:hypothetical protein